MTPLNSSALGAALYGLGIDTELAQRQAMRRKRELASHQVKRKSPRWHWKKARAAGTDTRRR